MVLDRQGSSCCHKAGPVQHLSAASEPGPSGASGADLQGEVLTVWLFQGLPSSSEQSGVGRLRLLCEQNERLGVHSH